MVPEGVVAVALIFTVELAKKVALLAGLVIDTTGGCALLTATFTTPEIATAFLLSIPLAVIA